MRLWEIDAFRGVAVILMVIFNWFFALAYISIFYLDLGFVYWFVFPRIIAGTFVFLSGLSLVLSYEKIRKKSFSKIREKYFLRGARIFFYGMLITAVTFFFVKDFIVFGILHLIGISIILSVPFLRASNKIIITTSVILTVTGILLSTVEFNFPWLLWLGFVPAGFQTLDYFPVLPWFGITLMGIGFGKFVYKKGRRPYKIKERKCLLSLIGRKSLFIYLVHQPLLLAVLYFLGYGLF